MNTTLDPEFTVLREKVESLGREIAELRATVQQLAQMVSNTNRQTIWQFVIFTVTMVVAVTGSIVGASTYQTESLRREMNVRFEAMEKRIEQSEKNLSERFEDLKQEVRANRAPNMPK
jgi:chaperonin cofactor prefoldin